MRIIAYILANCAAILAANWLVPGFSFRGDWMDLAVAGTVLGVINSLLRPLIRLVSLPIIILTLGLFTIIINIALLNLADRMLSSLTINSFWAAFWGVIVISLINHLIMSAFKPKED